MRLKNTSETVSDILTALRSSEPDAHVILCDCGFTEDNGDNADILSVKYYPDNNTCSVELGDRSDNCMTVSDMITVLEKFKPNEALEIVNPEDNSSTEVEFTDYYRCSDLFILNAVIDLT